MACGDKEGPNSHLQMQLKTPPLILLNLAWGIKIEVPIEHGEDYLEVPPKADLAHQ